MSSPTISVYRCWDVVTGEPSRLSGSTTGAWRSPLASDNTASVASDVRIQEATLIRLHGPSQSGYPGSDGSVRYTAS